LIDLLSTLVPEFCPELPSAAAVGLGVERCFEIRFFRRRLAASPAVRFEENNGKENPGG
jgi:hypothetical protein